MKEHSYRRLPWYSRVISVTSSSAPGEGAGRGLRDPFVAVLLLFDLLDVWEGP